MKKLLVILVLTAALLSAGCKKPNIQIIQPEMQPETTPQPETTSSVQADIDIVNPNQTYSYEQMCEDAQTLADTYPELVTKSVIGQSVEGRDILLLTIGKGEKKIVLAGAHHAREYMTTTFLMETADEYAQAYTSDNTYGNYDMKTLLDTATVYIVPMVNPDGVNLVQNGVESAKDPESVKNMRMLKDGYNEWKANINGVDLNRQYPCHWDEKQSSTDVPSSEMYKGTAPATEPEVQAMMQLCSENEFILAASFHTKGEVIYWADSGTQDAIAAGSQIAQGLAAVTGYELMPVSEDPAVYGAGFENWFRQDFSRPAFCVELTPVGNGSTPHNDEEFSSLIWDKAKYLCAELFTQALEQE